MVRLSLRLGDHIPMFGRFKQGAITMRMAIGRRAMTTRAPANQIKMTDEQFKKAWSEAKPFSSIPGPNRFQLIRCSLPGGDLYNAPIDKIQQYYRKQYGDIVRLPGVFGKRDMLITFDPKMYEIVYRTEGNWPLRRAVEPFEYFRKHVRPELYHGIGGLIFDQGETWGSMRKTVNPVMMKPQAVKRYVPIIDQVTREFITKVDKLRDVNCEMPANFSHAMALWAIESIGVIALDKRLGMLEDKRNEEADRVIQATRDFFVLSHAFESEPSVWRYYQTKKFNKLMSAFDTIASLGAKYVNEALVRMEQMEKDGSHGDLMNEESVLQKLLRVDRRHAIVMVFDMIFAGIDSTAGSNAILLYNLARNPEKQAKLTEEIFKVLPEIDSPLTEEILNNMPYLRACIKESMRLQPLTPAQLRGTGQDIILNGYQVPKATDVGMAMMSYEDSYFTEAKSFLPERWFRESAVNLPPAAQASPFTFLPFGFGPRSCIGRRFAELEIEILTTRILREYRVEWHHDPMKYDLCMLYIPSSPLRYRFIRHDGK